MRYVFTAAKRIWRKHQKPIDSGARAYRVILAPTLATRKGKRLLILNMFLGLAN